MQLIYLKSIHNSIIPGGIIMINNLINYLRDVNFLSIVIRLTLAIICGGVIGFERGKKGKAAGFRTHILVCIGSTLVMITNQYIVQVMGFDGDPTRLGAQVISGIGFLGAGTILITGKQQVRGLTTAAGLWASACMGLAIGIGFYEGALIGCVFIFASMTFLQRFDNYGMSDTEELQLMIELKMIKGIRDVMNLLKRRNLKVTGVEILKTENVDDTVCIFITALQKESVGEEELISALSTLDYVTMVQII